MPPQSDDRAVHLAAFEDHAERMILHQLDLLAQVEEQLRGVHHVMRGLERLRSGKQRVGPEPSNGERGDVLGHLSRELAALDRHVATQSESVHGMQGLIAQMQERLADLKRTAMQLEGRDRSPEEGGASSPQS